MAENGWYQVMLQNHKGLIKKDELFYYIFNERSINEILEHELTLFLDYKRYDRSDHEDSV